MEQAIPVDASESDHFTAVPPLEASAAASSVVTEPQSGVVNKPQSGKKAAKLPDSPGKNVTADEFFRYVAQLSESDWAHLECYVYSTWPVMLADRSPRYIDKLGKTFDREYMVAEWGSGDYYFTLNDSDVRGSNRTIVQVNKNRPLSIRDPENPPKRNLEEVAWNDPANAEWKSSLIRQGKLTSTGDVVTPQAAAPDPSNAILAATMKDAFTLLLKERGQPQGAGVESKAFERVIEMMKGASDQSIQIALSQVKQQDPMQFVQLIGALKDLMPQSANTDMMQMLLQVQRDGQKQVTDLLLKVMEKESQPKESTSFRDRLEDLQLLRELLDSGRGGGGKWWETALNVAPAILSNVAQIFTPIFNRGGQPGTVSAPAQAMPSNSNPSSQTNTTSQPPAAIAAPETDERVQQLVQFMPIIAQPMMKYLNEGRTGADFADWISDSYGEMTYGTVRQLSKDQILAALNAYQPTAQFVAAMPERLSQFVDEFLHPELVPIDDGSPDDVPEPAVAGGKKVAKK